MRVTFFSARRHDRESFDRANHREAHTLDYLDVALSPRTAALASGADAACLFVNDQADAAVLDALSSLRVGGLALRCAGFNNVDVAELLEQADIVTLNCPLTASTHHLIDADAVGRMRPGTMLVNTGRGALIDTPAVIDGLKSERIGALALDVYEEEGPLFFEDRSTQVITDDVFSRLLTFPNVLITAHQAFFTVEAIDAIARTTLANLDDLAAGRPCRNDLTRP